MRILYVTPFYVPIIGGVETVVYETCLGLVKLGHTPIVLTSQVPNCPDHEIRSGVEVIRAAELNIPEDGKVVPNCFNTDRTAKFFSELVNELDVDIIHLHNYHMRQYAMFLFSFLKDADKRRILISIHNDTGDEFAHYLLSYLPFSKIIALTHKSAFDLIKGGVPSARIEVVPNMLDVKKFSVADGRSIREALGVDKEDPIILFPSRLIGRERNVFLNLEKGKGLDILLRALPLVKREVPNVKLLLMGNDPIYIDPVFHVRKWIMDLARVLAVNDNILFFDEQIPQEKIPEVFAASDIVVSLGATECFGMVFLEGMAAGKPVIGVNSTDNGVPEVVWDGKAGLLVPPNDPWSTAKNIITILSDRNLASRIGMNGQNWVKSRYDTMQVLPHLIDIYEQCKKTEKTTTYFHEKRIAILTRHP